MVKNVLLVFEDNEAHAKLFARKGKHRTWTEFVLMLAEDVSLDEARSIILENELLDESPSGQTYGDENVKEEEG